MIVVFCFYRINLNENWGKCHHRLNLWSVSIQHLVYWNFSSSSIQDKIVLELRIIKVSIHRVEPRQDEEHYQDWHCIHWQFYRPSFVFHWRLNVVVVVEYLNQMKFQTNEWSIDRLKIVPSFSSTRSLIRSILSVPSISTSISFPVNVFTLIIIFGD